MLQYLDHRHPELGIETEDFYTPFIYHKLDAMVMPVEWLSNTTGISDVHLLSYPFLFPPSTLVTYFRAINFAAMQKAFELSTELATMAMRMSSVAASGEERIYSRLKTAMAPFLVLDIKRNRILESAVDQIWRREKRELFRPLKIRLGMEEGEEGVDHGGVQQEFFRLAFGQAMDPDYGIASILFVIGQVIDWHDWQACLPLTLKHEWPGFNRCV